MTETRVVSTGQEIATAPRRFEEAIRLQGVWLTQGRWAPEVHWPAQEDLSVRGTSVILRQPVSPSGIDQQRARYRRGLGSEARIVLAVVARSFGATFGLVDLREPEANRNGRPTVEFELWEFPLRLMTARHRTGWWRLQDAARHPHLARLLKEFGKL